MMTNHDESVEINHNPNWSQIPDHPSRILIIWGPGSSKNNMLLKMIKHQPPYVVKKYLFIKDPFESKSQLLSGREKVDIKNLKIQSHLLIIHKQYMMFMKIQKTIIQQRKENIMIADMEANKN